MNNKNIESTAATIEALHNMSFKTSAYPEKYQKQHSYYQNGGMRWNRLIHVIIAFASLSIFLFLLVNEVHVESQEEDKKTDGQSTEILYQGTPWRNERTIDIQTLAETKFARCDMHTVMSEDGQSTVNDWLFLEEMNAVNVAVVTSDRNFVVFKQQKYAIPGETLSPVGGFIDKDEAPWESARREVMEELGLGSRKTLEDIENVIKANNSNINASELQDNLDNKAAFSSLPKLERTVDSFDLANGNTDESESDWLYLGRYRTAANRGGGFIYTYLLKNAVPILPNGGTPQFQITGDDEAQQIHFLTVEETLKHLYQGDFQEVKWTATLSLALLRLQDDQ